MKTKYSQILKQNISINQTDQSITTEDGQIYSREELSLIDGCIPESKIWMHKLKKLFNGEIVNVGM